MQRFTRWQQRGLLLASLVAFVAVNWFAPWSTTFDVGIVDTRSSTFTWVQGLQFGIILCYPLFLVLPWFSMMSLMWICMLNNGSFLKPSTSLLVALFSVAAGGTMYQITWALKGAADFQVVFNIVMAGGALIHAASFIATFSKKQS